MFTFKSKDAEKKFPAAFIFQSRFRGSHFFTTAGRSVLEKFEVEEGAEPQLPLGLAMRNLFTCTWTSERDTPACEAVIEDALQVIQQMRKISDVEEQYDLCKKIAASRDQINEYPYDQVNSYPEMTPLWGITQQLRFGLLLADVLHRYTDLSPRKLDPVFGSLLSPTGGILGTPLHWIHKTPILWQNGPLAYQSICEDASYYMKMYHNHNLSENGKYTGTFTWYWIDIMISKIPIWY